MMNAWNIDGSGRERGILVGLLAGTVLILAVLFFALLLPVQRRRTAVADDRAEVAKEVEALPSNPRGSVVQEHAAARDELQRLEARWTVLREDLDSFKTPPSFTRAADPTGEGRIDFKVALFEARSLLLQKAEAGGVKLPEALGIDETIGADEDAETRLWQLAALVKLVENCIDIGMPGVEHIDMLAPYDHTASANREIYTREFPTRIRLASSFEQTRRLLDMLLEEGSFFALRGFRAERMSKYRHEPLEVTAVYSGQLFDVPQEPEPPEGETVPEPVTGPIMMGPATNGLPGEVF